MILFSVIVATVSDENSGLLSFMSSIVTSMYVVAVSECAGDDVSVI